MHKSNVLKNGMSHFEREKGKAITNPSERNDYTYEYLIELLKSFLVNALEDKQVQARKAATLSHPRGKGPNAAPAIANSAAPAPKKGGGRGNGSGGGGGTAPKAAPKQQPRANTPKGAPRQGKGGDGARAQLPQPSAQFSWRRRMQTR